MNSLRAAAARLHRCTAGSSLSSATASACAHITPHRLAAQHASAHACAAAMPAVLEPLGNPSGNHVDAARDLADRAASSSRPQPALDPAAAALEERRARGSEASGWDSRGNHCTKGIPTEDGAQVRCR